MARRLLSSQGAALERECPEPGRVAGAVPVRARASGTGALASRCAGRLARTSVERPPAQSSHPAPPRRTKARRVLLAILVAGGAGVRLTIACLPTNRLADDRPLLQLQRSRGSVDDWIRGDRFESPGLKRSGRYQTRLIAERFHSWAYAKMDPHSQRLGSVRAGRLLWGRPEPSRRGCRAGWFALAQGGYACSSGSFRLAGLAEGERVDAAPALDAALPYRYVQVTTEGAPRYSRIPSSDEEVAVWAGRDRQTLPLEERMVGDYFLAINGEELHQGRRFHRTLGGKFVRVEDVGRLPATTLHGEKNPALPLAFVVDDEAPVFGFEGVDREELGVTVRYSSFPVERAVMWHGEPYVVGIDGLALRQASVAVARSRPPPDEVGEREKWIVVDLSEQTLVAYEGQTAVFATLVSSGKPGHETPTGAFRIGHKHVSTTMTGTDPVDGPYHVEEVPWTMYYDGGYALHGAYWHDQFGRVRSHGCTNLAPADARWLLRWSDPRLPTGWQSIRPHTPAGGTRIYITP
jgi:hypothetical protein